MSPTLTDSALTNICQELDLPPLPSIPDEDLVKLVFTHSSLYAKPRSEVRFQHPSEEIRDNEKLEFVIKTYLIRNSTLAELTLRYKLHYRLRGYAAARSQLLSSENVLAGLFEAYIAGLYEYHLKAAGPADADAEPDPDPGSGVGSAPRKRRRAESSMTLVEEDHSARGGGKDPLDPSASAAREGHAFAQIFIFLSGVFTPLALAIQEKLTEGSRLPGDPDADDYGDDDDDLDAFAVGALAKLNEHCIGILRVRPVILYSSIGARWEADIAVKTPADAYYAGEAVRTTKKQAATVAAYKVCLAMGIQSRYQRRRLEAV